MPMKLKSIGIAMFRGLWDGDADSSRPKPYMIHVVRLFTTDLQPLGFLSCRVVNGATATKFRNPLLFAKLFQRCG